MMGKDREKSYSDRLVTRAIKAVKDRDPNFRLFLSRVTKMAFIEGRDNPNVDLFDNYIRLDEKLRAGEDDVLDEIVEFSRKLGEEIEKTRAESKKSK